MRLVIILILIFLIFLNIETVIIEGDSLSDPRNTPSSVWPNRIGKNVINLSLNGKKVSTIIDEYQWKVHPIRKGLSWHKRYFAVFAGINDILAGTSAENVYRNLKLIWLLGRNDGMKVIAFTIATPLSLNVEEILKLNRLIRSDQSLYDCLIETDNLDSKYFLIDMIHLTRKGSNIISKRIIFEMRKINSLANKWIHYKANTKQSANKNLFSCCFNWVFHT